MMNPKLTRMSIVNFNTGEEVAGYPSSTEAHAAFLERRAHWCADTGQSSTDFPEALMPSYDAFPGTWIWNKQRQCFVRIQRKTS